jgi:PhnB protein
MAIKKATPYLNFDGTAERAIKLYESALGARTETIQRFGEMPGAAPEHKNRVLHALLHLGDAILMMSDTQPGTPLRPGINLHVALDFDDVADMARKFDSLAKGGKVTLPLADAPWGARFGMLTDAHGINWMFNCAQKR